MKVVFVEPLGKFVNWNFGWVARLPFLGPVYLATILKKRGHDVEMYKESIRPIDPKKINADVLCIHTLTSSAKRAYEIAEEFKKLNPQAKVIVGGIHVSLMPHEAPKCVDHVVLGEAESVIADVVEGRIKNRIVKGKPVENLDEIPFPDYNLIHRLGKMRYLPVSTSRGCPFDCNFCSVTQMFGKCYRFRSPDSVVAELANQKYKNIFFYDDNFAAHKARAREILKKMKDQGLDKPWMTQLRTDATKNDELMTLMSDTNCDYLILGFESLTDDSLKFYHKSQKLEDIKFAIKRLKDYGIKIYGFFVFGADYDTKRSIRATVDFCDDMELERVNFTALTPLPGTKFYNELDMSRRIFTKDWSCYDFRHVTFTPMKMTALELQQEIDNALYRTYWMTKRGFKVFFENFRDTFSIIKTLKTYHRENVEYQDFLRKIAVKKQA